MTATSVVCPECGSPVAPGHLSCQACGTLLASVVGSERRPSWAGASSEAADIDEDRPIASARSGDPLAEPDPVPEVAAVTAVATEPAPATKRGPRRLSRPKVPAAPAKARSVKGSPADAVPPVDTEALFGPVPNVAPPILHDWADPPAAPNGSVPAATNGFVSATSNGASAARASGAVATATPVAGAYLAPSATYVAPPIAARSPVTPPPAAPAWPAAPGSPAPASAPGGTGTSTMAAGAAAPVSSEQATARRVADWLIIGGSVLAIVSFLLPWATDGVIGSFGTGFTADWGLANPGHLLLIAAAVAVLLLHAFDNPVPDWFRSGALPLLVGGVLAGLAFAYYARPAGGGAGVAVLLAGAVVLIVGGMLASRPQRHVSSTPTV
jgi:hypothetical protein